MRRHIVKTAKSVLFGSGVLTGYHRARNGRALTVTMFHRVLGRADPRWATADPTYSVTDEFFRASLDFFRAHYNVIDLKKTGLGFASAELPPRPLLITFDDGWADTADCALPILREAGLTALLFVAASAVGQREAFWQERIFAAWRKGAIGAAEIAAAWPRTADAGAPPARADEAAIRALIARLTALPSAARAPAIERLIADQHDPQVQMMTPEQLRAWDAAGMSTGAHGDTHEPLVAVADPRQELSRSRRLLGEVLGEADGPPTMSFPHGRYDPALVTLARGVGFKRLFTSNPILNRAGADGRYSDVLGRVGIDAGHVGDSEGRMRPDRMAARLFTRPARDIRIA